LLVTREALDADADVLGVVDFVGQPLDPIVTTAAGQVDVADMLVGCEQV
jgi:hypothetical protein